MKDSFICGRHRLGVAGLLGAAAAIVLAARSERPLRAAQAPQTGAEPPALARHVSLAGRAADDSTCPASVGRFEAARAGRDDEWTAAQRAAGWTEAEVSRVVRDAAAEAARHLAPVAGRVCVQLAAEPRNPVLSRMRGITGNVRFDTSTIALLVAPSLGSSRWRQDLAWTVMHEYDHLWARRGGGTGLDVLVREGLAHHFAWTRDPDRLHPSAAAIPEGPEEADAWRIIRAQLHLPGADFTNRFMFGGDYFGGEVPTWAGYTIGFRLAQSYASRHPGETPRSMGGLPAARILEGSRFGSSPDPQRHARVQNRAGNGLERRRESRLGHVTPGPLPSR